MRCLISDVRAKRQAQQEPSSSKIDLRFVLCGQIHGAYIA
jgi:hypothetical protein